MTRRGRNFSDRVHQWERIWLHGGPTAAQITEQIQRTITLAAVDLSAIPELSNAVNDLSYALQNEDQRQVAQARNYAQSFTSIFGNQVPPSYIDLGNFAHS